METTSDSVAWYVNECLLGPVWMCSCWMVTSDSFLNAEVHGVEKSPISLCGFLNQDWLTMNKAEKPSLTWLIVKKGLKCSEKKRNLSVNVSFITLQPIQQILKVAFIDIVNIVKVDKHPEECQDLSSL